MSEHEPESPEADPNEGLEGVQEAELDSVQGGGSVREPAMDIEPVELDTVQKNDDPDGYETKDGPSND